MTVTAKPKICVEDGNLMVHGKRLLSEVPNNILVSPAHSNGAAFLGAISSHTKSLHVFPLGILQYVPFFNYFPSLLLSQTPT